MKIINNPLCLFDIHHFHFLFTIVNIQQIYNRTGLKNYVIIPTYNFKDIKRTEI